MAKEQNKFNFYLTVSQDFDNYKKGDHITDELEIEKVLQSHADFVIKTALRGKK